MCRLLPAVRSRRAQDVWALRGQPFEIQSGRKRDGRDGPFGGRLPPVPPASVVVRSGYLAGRLRGGSSPECAADETARGRVRRGLDGPTAIHPAEGTNPAVCSRSAGADSHALDAAAGAAYQQCRGRGRTFGPCPASSSGSAGSGALPQHVTTERLIAELAISQRARFLSRSKGLRYTWCSRGLGRRHPDHRSHLQRGSQDAQRSRGPGRGGHRGRPSHREQRSVAPISTTFQQGQAGQDG